LALNELRRSVVVPTPAELRDRFTAREVQPYIGETPAQSTRAERDARGRVADSWYPHGESSRTWSSR